MTAPRARARMPAICCLPRGLGHRAHRAVTPDPPRGPGMLARRMPPDLRPPRLRPRMRRAARRGTRRPRLAWRMSGGASRIASGWTALTRNPAWRQAASTAAAGGPGQQRGEPQPRPAPRRAADGRSRRCRPRARRRPPPPGPAGRRSRSCRARRARPRRPPGCRRTCCRGRPCAAPWPRRAEPDAGADRQPAAQPLGQGEHVRHDPVGLVGEPGAGAADPALDLVDHQQRAGGVAGLPGRRSGTRRAAAPPRASPWHGSRNTAAQSAADGCRRARPRRRRGRTGPRPRTGRTAAVSPPCRSARASPWSGHGSRPRRRR